MQCTEPAGLSGWVVSDPKTDRVNDQNIGEPSNDCFPASVHRFGFSGDHAQRALYPLRLWRRPRVNHDYSRQERDELLRGGIVELEQAANHRRLFSLAS